MRLEYLLDKYPEAKDREKALYYLTRNYKELDRPDKAQYYFDMLAKEYPKSIYVRPSAKERKARGASPGATAHNGDVVVATAPPAAAVINTTFSYDERKKREIPLRPIEPMPNGDVVIQGQEEAPQTVVGQAEKKKDRTAKPSGQSSEATATKSGAASPAADLSKSEQPGAVEKPQAARGDGDEKKDSLGFFTGKGPIEIDGDTGESLEKGKVLIFKGNVVAKQIDPDPAQTFYLFCDKLTAYTSEDTKEMERAEAEGNVKLVKQDKTATSKQAFYYKEKAQLILKGDVVMFLGADKLSADTVIYYIDEDRFYVQGDREKRAKATITPKKK